MIGLCYLIQVNIKQNRIASQFYIMMYMLCNSILAFEWDIVIMPETFMFPTSLSGFVIANEVVNLFGMTRRLYKNCLNFFIWIYLLARIYHQYGYYAINLFFAMGFHMCCSD
jgi:hypothetical protein